MFVLPSRTLVLIWAGGLLLPLVYDDAYVLRILTMTCIFAIFAASWDLLAGYTGQVNFGHALFFGAGAYGSGLASLKLGVSPWLTIWLGAAIAARCSAIFGLSLPAPARLDLSLATLAFPLIGLGLLFAFPDFSGGELGVSGLQRMLDPAANYYVACVSMLVMVFGLSAAGRLALRHRAARDSRRRSRGARLGHQHAALQAGGVRAFGARRPVSPARCSRTTCASPGLRRWRSRFPSRW